MIRMRDYILVLLTLLVCERAVNYLSVVCLCEMQTKLSCRFEGKSFLLIFIISLISLNFQLTPRFSSKTNRKLKTNYNLKMVQTRSK